MSDSPTSEPESTFVCDCEEWMRSACEGQPFYKAHEGTRYCVFHLPGKEKSTDFEKALQRKLENKDFDFRGVWFPDEVAFSEFDFSVKADFRKASFSAFADFSFATFNAVADFRYATFSALAYFGSATFSGEAYFDDATFSAAAALQQSTFKALTLWNGVTFGSLANFRIATFSAEAEFRGAIFNAKADFRHATFCAEADFALATFSAEAEFADATFSAKANFSEATFADRVSFSGNEARAVFIDTLQLNIQFARVETPDHVSFHTAVLRPHWFVNVDARKFDFTNVDWDRRSIDEEITSLENNNVSSPHRLLAIACRHLAVNAEESHRYEEPSGFRYMAMDVRRRERLRGFAFWRLS